MEGKSSTRRLHYFNVWWPCTYFIPLVYVLSTAKKKWDTLVFVVLYSSVLEERSLRAFTDVI